MKITIKTVLALLCLGSVAILLYTNFYGDYGADGLGNFFTAVIFGILFIASLIGLIASLISNLFPKKNKKRLLLFALCTPAIGIAVILYIFSMFDAEHTTRIEEGITEEKSVNHTETFQSEVLKLEFYHVSGEVIGRSNNMPTIAPIIPKVVDSILIIPENEDAYASSPDKLFFIKKEKKITTEKYLTRLIQQNATQEKECTLKTVNVSKVFHYLNPKTATVFMIQPSSCSYLDIPVLLQKLLPGEITKYRKAYFIDSPYYSDSIMVIAICNDALSANAKIEDLSPDNLRNRNKWYNTLKLLK